MRIIFGRFCALLLNINVPYCGFWLNKIPYLKYVISWESIKPEQKKVQKIIDIGRPTITTEAQALICIVCYYKDMSTRQYNILALITDADSGLKSRKML